MTESSGVLIIDLSDILYIEDNLKIALGRVLPKSADVYILDETTALLKDLYS